MANYLSTLPLTILVFCVVSVCGDGNGLIGWGKTLYNPPCAFACRGVLKNCQLECTPEASGENHGTAHNPVDTPPDCFVTDPVFLRSIALCIDTYCSVADRPKASLIEDYWASHLGTGTIGNYEYVPAMSYNEALKAAREHERSAASPNDTMETEVDHAHRVRIQHQHDHGAMVEPEAIGPDLSSSLPIIVSGDPLNETSFVAPEDWQLQYNGMTDFETNEAGHSTYTIVVTLVALFLPVILSLIRFVPGYRTSATVAFVKAILIQPAVWGKKHREPVAALVGGVLLPTRGQAFYIALISFLNAIFLIAPYVHTHPQSTFASGSNEQSVSTIGNRAGVMAMGNAVAMFVFATHNNVLLAVTDWSHGTYILLHRCLGYWTIFHTVLHSILLLVNYKKYGSYAEELIRMYWIWGIVATVAVCAILPTSLLVVRQRKYVFFKASHVGLTVLFIVGYYHHIWYCYGFSWGYEIFAYVIGGIWGLEHVVRIGRLMKNGVRTAVVTPVQGTEGEYVRIEVEGVALSGTAYLTFPTLSWRFWDSHPFSVAYSGEKSAVIPVLPAEKSEHTEGQTHPPKEAITLASPGKKSIFITRTRSGGTALLGKRTLAAGLTGARLKVLIDGSYVSTASQQLIGCHALLCIGGGIGITALLPLLRDFPAPQRCRLHWGARRSDLVNVLAAELAHLPEGVEIETTVGKRLDLEGILKKELVWAGPDEGRLGIVVCGPASMADDVRDEVARIGRETSTRRPHLFVDEAFSW